MKIAVYQIDAFTDHIFSGNPALVIPLDDWLPDETMLCIAQENKLPIAVFYIRTGDRFQIRWFTPASESNLCGHGTLAAAFVIKHCYHYESQQIFFDSPSGELVVTAVDEWIRLDFPVSTYKPALAPPALLEGLKGNKILEVLKSSLDYMVVLSSEQELVHLDYDIIVLSTIPARGIIATAPGNEVDFVSRFFAPQSGIDEDPVTGSTHTLLTAYWAEKLSKTCLTARQLSARGGYLNCQLAEGRVQISGQAKLYLKGEIDID